MDLPYQPEPLDAMIDEKLFLGNVATAMSASLMEAYGFFSLFIDVCRCSVDENCGD